MCVVHRLPTSSIACIPWNVVPACEVAYWGDTSRVHVDVLIVLAAPALSERNQSKNLVKMVKWNGLCDLHHNGGTKEVCDP